MVATDKGWIGVDFDGVLARYTPGQPNAGYVPGPPIPKMVARVRRWLAEGREVRIFTARCSPLNNVPTDAPLGLSTFSCDDSVQAGEVCKKIRTWCFEQFGRRLYITNVKDMRCVEIYDDRCVQVLTNTGNLVGKSSRGIPG